MHLFASLLFALVLTLKRSLFAETDVSLLETEACEAGEQTKLFCVGNRSLLFSVDAFLLGRVDEQSNKSQF